MATLGLLDQLSSGLASVISSLLRVTGRTMPADAQLNKTQPVTGLSTITQEHNALGNAGHQKTYPRPPNEPVVLERLQRAPIQINNLRR